MRIAVIIGSTRPGRRGEAVARWVQTLAAQRGDAVYEIVDLADHDLPHLDEPVPAAMGAEHYTGEHTRRWAETIASYDGFVFVTPEYNHSYTAVLKNAIDYLYTEWHNKSAGFVGYGLNGGTRAVEHLRVVLAELHVADVRDQVCLNYFTEFGAGGEVLPAEHQEDILRRMLDQVVAWGGALATLRQP
ncbi:NAD(P)H-dependent oxidoreductase [Micromonospora matsumotoense]|uniref:NAD(P)H-dependent FMN reductase n=1 Tax=Micromonospora matsumotoense TaxID=121616 RepID=A0A1C5A398_9ACTN|nr:NAD(P)H-dependent oxidoreductase [Micromonospora matsumotoense]SCF39524.1 NAD(P)H-dependent FMN reductase [Micromonospora matsumotoense]